MTRSRLATPFPSSTVRRRLGVVCAVVIAVAAVGPAVAGAAGADGPTRVAIDAPGAAPLVADLEGAPISATDVGRHFCHDMDAPRIHCYSSLETLDAAVAARLAADSTSVTPAGTDAVTYVRIFEHAEFQGAAAYLSQDYQNLGSIGWNDRVSSLQGLASASGRFFEHAYFEGAIYSFCCNQQTYNVGSFWNDRFSSVWQN